MKRADNMLLDSVNTYTISLSFISDCFAEHLKRLRDCYFSTLEDYQNAYPGRMPLVVWQLGGEFSGEQLANWISQSKPSAIDQEWPLETEWIYFRRQARNAGRYGKIKFSSTQINLFEYLSASDEEWCQIDRMRDLVRRANGLEMSGSQNNGAIGTNLDKEVWPDVIIMDNFLSGLGADTRIPPVADCLNFFYHFVDPGGLFVAMEPEGTQESCELKKFFKDNRGSVVLVNGVVSGTLYKEPNIYRDPKANIRYSDPNTKTAGRKDIFDDHICQDTINRTMDRVELNKGSRVLDVGIGDGRFSQYVVRVCKARSWSFHGIENSPHSAMHATCPELEKGKDNNVVVEYGRNFFALPSGPQYGAVCLFFVLHSLKYWKLYLYKAAQLLQDDGRIILSLREDNFTYWLNGIFSDSFLSPIKQAWTEYWQARSRWGIRNPLQMLTVIWDTLVISAAEEIGFESVRHPIVVSGLRRYNLHSADLCHGQEKGAVWNIAEVGVTTQDREHLKNALKSSLYVDELYETVATLIFRKNHAKQ